MLLHGLGADHRAFQRFERLLPREWRITSLDLLGHGEAPKPDHGYSLDAHAAHIGGELEQLGIGAGAAAHLVGHSYGAATAVAVAGTRPELVRSLVLLDAVVAIRVTGNEGGGTRRMIEAKRHGSLPETVAAMYPDASTALRSWTVATWTAMSIGVVDELDPDWQRFAGAVVCPVTIVHGDPERGGAGDVAADWFDDPAVVRIAGAGHYLHATHAREVADAVAAAVAAND